MRELTEHELLLLIEYSVKWGRSELTAGGRVGDKRDFIHWIYECWVKKDTATLERELKEWQGRIDKSLKALEKTL